MELIIDRLFKVEQFIDEVHLRLCGPLLIVKGYNAIIRYNDFMKACVKEELCVNNVVKPDRVDFGLSHKTGNDAYFSELREWEQAEKKIIFKGIRLENGTLYWKDKVLGGTFNNWQEVERMSLLTLADKTDGLIETKNIKI